MLTLAKQPEKYIWFTYSLAYEQWLANLLFSKKPTSRKTIGQSYRERELRHAMISPTWWSRGCHVVHVSLNSSKHAALSMLFYGTTAEISILNGKYEWKKHIQVFVWLLLHYCIFVKVSFTFRVLGGQLKASYKYYLDTFLSLRESFTFVLAYWLNLNSYPTSVLKSK